MNTTQKVTATLFYFAALLLVFALVTLSSYGSEVLSFWYELIGAGTLATLGFILSIFDSEENYYDRRRITKEIER